MGILNKLFGDKKRSSEVPPTVQNFSQQKQDSYTFSTDSFGATIIDYCETSPDTFKGYDCTHLYIYHHPTILSNNLVCNAKVSWFGSHDAGVLDRETKTCVSPRKKLTEKIQLGIDLNKLDDPEYLKVLFTELLDQRRVNHYLEMGLQPNPEKECGNYVGKIYMKNGTYSKGFRPEVGAASHNLPEQVTMREDYIRDQQIKGSHQYELDQARKRVQDLEQQYYK